MQVQQKLLDVLASGQIISGAMLAERSGVTRAAIWKQVEALRARGVPIEARAAAGYRLPWPLQMLDAEKIAAALPKELTPRLGGLEIHWELDSTSSELQRRGARAADLSMLLAETQHAGRGRRGRPWLSPPGLNVYLSCLKRFDAGFSALSGLSLALGVMAIHALAALGIRDVGLKWPNDVLAHTHNEPMHDQPTRGEHSLHETGGKLAGILVELSGEYQGPCVAVVGIGLNLRLTAALRAQAGQPTCDLASLADGEPPDRNRVASALIAALLRGLPQFERDGFAGFVEDYARHDLLRDLPLRISATQGHFDGIGAGVDTRGALLLRTIDGLRRIDGANVTVRTA